MAGPAVIVVLPIPTFDMPGSGIAYPVKAESGNVQGIQVVFLGSDEKAAADTEKSKSDELKDKIEPEGGAH